MPGVVVWQSVVAAYRRAFLELVGVTSEQGLDG